MKTATELAQAVRDEEMEFDDALLEYLMGNYLDLSFFMTLTIAISYANTGEWEKEIPFSEDEKLTVREVVSNFGLGPFVDS
jgi:hypothetical protein